MENQGLWLFRWSQLTMQPSNYAAKKQFELILKQPLISVWHLNMYKCLKELKRHYVLQTKFSKLLYNRF